MLSRYPGKEACARARARALALALALTEALYGVDDQAVFPHRPRALPNVRVEVVVPSLAALLAYTAG